MVRRRSYLLQLYKNEWGGCSHKFDERFIVELGLSRSVPFLCRAGIPHGQCIFNSSLYVHMMFKLPHKTQPEMLQFGFGQAEFFVNRNDESVHIFEKGVMGYICQDIESFFLLKREAESLRRALIVEDWDMDVDLNDPPITPEEIEILTQESHQTMLNVDPTIVRSYRNFWDLSTPEEREKSYFGYRSSNDPSNKQSIP